MLKKVKNQRERSLAESGNTFVVNNILFPLAYNDQHLPWTVFMILSSM